MQPEHTQKFDVGSNDLVHFCIDVSLLFCKPRDWVQTTLRIMNLASYSLHLYFYLSLLLE